MSVKEVYERLGIVADYEQEVIAFNERLLLILDAFYQKHRGDEYDSLVKEFAFLLGESRYYGIGFNGRYTLSLNSFFEEGGTNVLQSNIKRLALLLKAARKTIGSYYNKNPYASLLHGVQRLFDTSPVEIGYLFANGSIIVQGAKGLDEKLILANLAWLSDYPNAREPFEKSLKHYLAKNYPDTITNAYSSLESLVKTFLGKDKSLDSQQTRAELIKKLQLEGDWGQLLNHFSKIAHEFSSRHGKSEANQDNELPPDLVEFYLYMTGTFIRLIMRRTRQETS